MRYGMLIGRRSWVTGGGGVLAASIFLGLLHAMLTAAIYVARVVCVGAVQLIGHVHVTHRARRADKLRPDARDVRRAQLAGPLRGSISIEAANAASGDAKVWAVYAVGKDFHHGRYPEKAEELLLLYPERAAEIAQIALLPEAGRARSAATQLQRLGFSYQEFLALFSDYYIPPTLAMGVEQEESTAALPRANGPASPIDTKEPNMKTGRDLTQYTFDGQTSGKGRLVLALVKRYVRDNPGTSFSAVRAAFPDALQANSPMQFSSQQCVVARLTDLSNEAQRRYFVGGDEQIPVSDCVAVVSREWNLHNIQNVLEAARMLGYQVTAEPRVP